MSKCFGCEHFKQTAPINFLKSGTCDWKPTEVLPQWLMEYIDSWDPEYGPQKDVGRGPWAISGCDAYVDAGDAVIAKRRSEEWYA